MEELKKILLIGPLPQPTGGISIHISRLTKLLADSFVIDHIDESYLLKPEYFNLRSFNLFKYLYKIYKSDLVYINSGTRLLRYIHLLTARILFKKIILTIHAYPFVERKVLIKIDELILNLADLIIVVSPQILNNISLPFKKCIIKHAFLPPIIESEPDLPVFVFEWIQTRRKAGSKIICSNANRLEIFNDQDLYGLDMCINVANELAKKNIRVSFIFNVSSLNKYRDEYFKYQDRIKNLNLQENFLLINEELSFVKLIMLSDIILRATNTDGDALTIREALYIGKPIIASDVVVRPFGTILFKSRDLVDFEKKLISIVSANPQSASAQNSEQVEAYRLSYTHMINSLILN